MTVIKDNSNMEFFPELDTFLMPRIYGNGLVRQLNAKMQ